MDTRKESPDTILKAASIAKNSAIEAGSPYIFRARRPLPIFDYSARMGYPIQVTLYAVEISKALGIFARYHSSNLPRFGINLVTHKLPR
jgi:hypothetical protein